MTISAVPTSFPQINDALQSNFKTGFFSRNQIQLAIYYPGLKASGNTNVGMAWRQLFPKLARTPKARMEGIILRDDFPIGISDGNGASSGEPG
jgi:hypothetical protein